MEYNSSHRNATVLIDATLWMNAEDTMPSERSQPSDITCYAIPAGTHGLNSTSFMAFKCEVYDPNVGGM